jgi:hypothetical protein
MRRLILPRAAVSRAGLGNQISIPRLWIQCADFRCQVLGVVKLRQDRTIKDASSRIPVCRISVPSSFSTGVILSGVARLRYSSAPHGVASSLSVLSLYMARRAVCGYPTERHASLHLRRVICYAWGYPFLKVLILWCVLFQDDDWP